MVVISDSDHYDVTKETMFDVTRLTSFLEKDASFLTPWSWDPKISTKENKFLSFHPESYFSYEEVIDASRKQKYVPDSKQKEDENKINDGMTRRKAQVNYNPCPPSARSNSQARYSVPLMFFNQAPIYFMIPMPMPLLLPLQLIQNPFLQRNKSNFRRGRIRRY